MGISASGHQQGLKVLVVDDDSLFCQVMEVILGLKPYIAEVRTAIGAAAAIEACKEFRPDVICVDHFMPTGNGDELGGSLRDLHPSVRLLSISGLQAKEKPSWADAHIMKGGDLFANLERMLRGDVAQA